MFEFMEHPEHDALWDAASRGLKLLFQLLNTPRMWCSVAVVWRIPRQGTFGGKENDKAHTIGVFNAHNESVKRTVPPERLLIYEVKEGWGPLCDFLNASPGDPVFTR